MFRTQLYYLKLGIQTLMQFSLFKLRNSKLGIGTSGYLVTPYFSYPMLCREFDHKIVDGHNYLGYSKQWSANDCIIGIRDLHHQEVDYHYNLSWVRSHKDIKGDCSFRHYQLLGESVQKASNRH